MELSPSTLDAILGAYGLTPSGAPAASGDRVWRLPTDRGDVAIKGFSPDQDAGGRREATLLVYLGSHPDARFRVQAPVVTTSGDTSFATAGMRVVLTRWESGDYRTYDRFTELDWAALGSTLASLHLCLDGMDAAPTDSLRSQLGDIDIDAERRRIDRDRARLPAHATLGGTRLDDYLDTCLRVIDACHPGAIGGFPHDDPQRPIHNDYNQFNYLFRDGLSPLILDWESALGAPREFEVVRCLNHLPLESPRLARAFVAAYLRVRPLNTGRMAWAVDTACLMHALKHWVLDGWLEHRDGYAERLGGAIRMVSMLSRERASLTEFFTRCAEKGS